jgi:hypothetical protein
MTPHRAVYDGQTRLGSVEQRDREFIARNNRNEPLGVFDTMIEAARAVGAAAEKDAAS